jgi:hypothetical protein
VLFERDELELTLRRGLSALSGTRELLTPTTLALSAALRFDEPEVGAFGRALAGVRAVNFDRLGGFMNPIPALPGPALTTQIFLDAPGGVTAPFDEREIALRMLREADPGIDDVEVIRDDTGVTAGGCPAPAPGALRRQPAAVVRHRTGVDRHADVVRAGRARAERAAHRQHPAVRRNRREPSPHLSAHLLELFQDPATNPRGAQLIFSTHDTSLLNHLNRDEVWLTEKDSDGSTRLTALAEYGGDKVRRSTNLERACLQGRFGALPQIDEVELRHALGLAAGDN